MAVETKQVLGERALHQWNAISTYPYTYCRDSLLLTATVCGRARFSASRSEGPPSPRKSTDMGPAVWLANSLEGGMRIRQSPTDRSRSLAKSARIPYGSSPALAELAGKGKGGGQYSIISYVGFGYEDDATAATFPHWPAPIPRHFHFMSELSTNQHSRKKAPLPFGERGP